MTPTHDLPQPAPAIPVAATPPDDDLSWGGRSSMAAFAMSGAVYFPRGAGRLPLRAKREENKA